MTVQAQTVSSAPVAKSDNGVMAAEVREEHIEPQDKHVLEMAIMQRKLAVSEAEKALAKNESAEMAHRLVSYQLFQKYGINPERDSIDDKGVIRRNSIEPKKA